ncbi:bacillithiol biosynthesis cysteine-adding enzyme BshC [Metabacillus sp. GX 13764]|uniref:bacillithiol biosynthesis cysteine-adding enzyme BshC n=1 Tax=Metabacillus kandeliae TaxID=2900151 RepID=UPI001E39D8F2|nr:bacillithiol biosynthesis cysteine-adding enzyme BshC [Metabacillus kandeliae]MCD7033901.1 bacillithiol biosynthesis cysteine-adding enzyme BshC [Metabacillus kandeliae]
MEIVELSLPSGNTFVQSLLTKQLKSEQYFHYSIHNEQSYADRLDYIANQTYNREDLVQYLHSYNKKYGSEASMKNIDRLRDPKSSAVIGGQQAGLLTGPLYTVHKIISIIVLARQQEQALKEAVVPVFWIAGEDHDFAEINHVYIEDKGRPKKKSIQQMQIEKGSVAKMPIDREKCSVWVDEIFQSFGETQHTNTLKAGVLSALEKSETYTDFFEWLVMDLFKEEGLVLVNSGDPEIRSLEQGFFKTLVQQNAAIEEAVLKQQALMKENGYSPIIEMAENTTGLFYEHQGERLLLYRNGQTYCTAANEVCLEESELLGLLDTHPERFSNNVVTRPMMQEYLFPALAFIAGPGEITYWGELKQAFEAAGMKMPLVVPRLNITLLERAVEADLQELQMDTEKAFFGDLGMLQEEWLDSRKTVPFEPLAQEVKEKIDSLHSRLREAAVEVDSSLAGFAEKNQQFILNQISILEKAVEKSVRLQNYNEISKFERISNAIKPNGHPQERIWNIFCYMNKYGSNILQDLTELPFSFNYQHKVVKI